MSSKASLAPHPLDDPYLRSGICKVSYVLPLVAVVHLAATSGVPSLFSVFCVILGVLVDTSFCMSVLLHRFFSHRAFHTGRTAQLVLAWLSCLAYQMGPLWWASKHRRHHKYCDTPKDPHSWIHLGWLQAWVGWTWDPKECSVDYEFLGALAQFPELKTVDRLWFLPPAALVAALRMAWNVHPAYPLMTMLLCRLATLQFNCEYHPPSDAARSCKSVNIVRFFSEVVGESHHEDHHSHPARARRPGLDVAFHLFITPLVAMRIAKLPLA